MVVLVICTEFPPSLPPSLPACLPALTATLLLPRPPSPPQPPIPLTHPDHPPPLTTTTTTTIVAAKSTTSEVRNAESSPHHQSWDCGIASHPLRMCQFSLTTSVVSQERRLCNKLKHCGFIVQKCCAALQCRITLGPPAVSTVFSCRMLGILVVEPQERGKTNLLTSVCGSPSGEGGSHSQCEADTASRRVCTP